MGVHKFSQWVERLPRSGEIDGFHYHFRSLEFLKDDIQNGSIPYIEHAEVHGNLYGTRQDAVDRIHRDNKVCVLDLDVKGVQQLKAAGFGARYLFLSPPSLQDLEVRLRGRQTESEESIQLRLANARAELKYGQKDGVFDYVLVNRLMDEAYNELEGLMKEWFKNQIVYGSENSEKVSVCDTRAPRREAALAKTCISDCDSLDFAENTEKIAEIKAAIAVQGIEVMLLQVLSTADMASHVLHMQIAKNAGFDSMYMHMIWFIHPDKFCICIDNDTHAHIHTTFFDYFNSEYDGFPVQGSASVENLVSVVKTFFDDNANDGDEHSDYDEDD
eukprot:gene30416-36750_t